MILVDTSVWVDHLRVGDGALTGLLETEVRRHYLVPVTSSGNTVQNYPLDRRRSQSVVFKIKDRRQLEIRIMSQY